MNYKIWQNSVDMLYCLALDLFIDQTFDKFYFDFCALTFFQITACLLFFISMGSSASSKPQKGPTGIYFVTKLVINGKIERALLMGSRTVGSSVNGIKLISFDQSQINISCLRNVCLVLSHVREIERHRNKETELPIKTLSKTG
jgi:hypothetical protein